MDGTLSPDKGSEFAVLLYDSYSHTLYTGATGTAAVETLTVCQRHGKAALADWTCGASAVRVQTRCNHILLRIVQWLDQIQLRPWGPRGTRGECTHSTYPLVCSLW